MKVGVGYCDNPETMEAGTLAVEQAIRQAGRTDPCDMVLLFSTAQHDPSVLREAVTTVIGDSTPIYGGGTAGVITNESFGYAGDQIGIACIWLDGVQCEVLVEDGMEKSEEETGVRLGHRLAQLGTQPDSPVMLFYDAVDRTNGLRLLMATYLLEGIEKGLGFPPNLSGVGMIGDLGCSPSSQWTGNGVSNFNAIALAFSGDIRMDYVILHGCRPSTQYYTVTKAAGPVILEINGKPAIQFLDELFESAISPEQYPFFLIFGINHGDRWGKYDEDYYASRLCLAIDKASGGIVMFEPDMVEGTEFQIMFRSLEHDYFKPKIEKVFAELDGREPVFGMFINCAGRCAGYAGAEMEDAPFIQQAVAGRVPVLGLYNGVEIAPIGGRPRGLDWTGVFCLFSQSNDGSGSSLQTVASKPVWEKKSAGSLSKEVSLDAITRISEQNAAKVLALDTMSTALRLELEQKRRGFSLLTELTVSSRKNASYENVFIPVAKRINAALNMQHTVVLEKKEDGLFSAVVLHGYSANEKAAFAGHRFHLPPEWLDPDNPVLVTGADPADRFQQIRELLGLPYFVASPVMLQGDVFAVLITGRLVEAPPYFVRLGRSDVETVQAISAFLASVLVEQRLVESDERTRIMIDALPVSCLLWDENGNLSDCNQATLSLFGLSTKSKFLKQFFDLLLPEYQPDGRCSVDAMQEIIQSAFVSGGVQCQTLLQTTSGEPLPVEMTLTRVPKGDGYTLVGYIRDLRDSMSTTKLAKAKEEFLASVSHEIRTPLNAIQSMALSVGKLKNLNDDQQSSINRGLQSITLLTSAIETILDFSKLDTGQLSLEASEFSVWDLVEGISEMACREAEEKSLYFRISIDSDIPDLVFGDPVRLQQILFNVVMNAVKFTETGGVNVHVFRNNDTAPNELPLIIEVKDTGIGISEEQMASLFKPLYSADMAYTRKHGGMGMGLAICHGLVTLMGGRITCESRLGEGSIFKIHITLSLPEEDTLGSGYVPEEADMKSLQGMRVLVAEDNKINQLIMKELLASIGIKVTLADNGIKALEQLRHATFDIVLMDIQMPEMDGLTATTQIRSDPRYADLPILAVTAHAGVEFVAESLSAGMNAHLTKPVDAKKLYGALKKWGKQSMKR